MLCDVPNKSSALEFVYFVNLAKACQHFRDEKLCPNKEDRDIRPPEPGWILWDDRCSKRVPSDANQHAMIAKFFQGIKRCTDSFRTIFGQFFLGKLFEAFRIHVYRILYSVLYMLQCTCNQLGTSTVSQFNSVRSHSARFYPYRYHRISVSLHQLITACCCPLSGANGVYGPYPYTNAAAPPIGAVFRVFLRKYNLIVEGCSEGTSCCHALHDSMAALHDSIVTISSFVLCLA